MSLDTEYLQQLDQISPNLKLPGKDIIPILERIYSAQPRRDQVQRSVMMEFPGKDPKGTFRAMVIPTTTRFHLVRVRSRKQVVSLAPNGKGTIAPNRDNLRNDVLSKCIRDYAVIIAGQDKESIKYFGNNSVQIRREHSDIHEKTERFINSYLNEFDVTLPSRVSMEDSSPIEVLYQKDGLWGLISDTDRRREWLVDSLPDHQFQQIDEARWRLMQEQLKQYNVLSSWLVDEAIKYEWKSDSPIIDLWKSSTHSDRKLAFNNESYEAVVLTN